MHRAHRHLPDTLVGAACLRPAATDDTALLEALDAEVAADGLPGLAPDDPLVALQVRAREADRVARWPDARREIVERDGEAVGALLVGEEADGALRLVDLHLSREGRGQGTGTSVLAQLAARADAAKRPLRLRTRQENGPMLASAARAGFVQVRADELGVDLERPPTGP